MQLRQKKNIRIYNSWFLLLPITGTLFLKKTASIKPSGENTLDFHLNMIKKIDAILEKHDRDTLVDEPDSAATPSLVPEVMVEPRPQLDRRLGHVAFDLPHNQESSFSKNNIPEEFTADIPLGREPEFKFITSLDPRVTMLHFDSRHQDRVEIIDLSEFPTDDVRSHLIAPITIVKSEQTVHKKHTKGFTQPFVVLDARMLNQTEYQEVFFNAAKQNDDIERKSKVFYLKDSKSKKEGFKQDYVPEDFEERARILQQKLKELRDQEDDLDEKIQKKLEKEKQQKREFEEKERKQREKEEQERREREEKERKRREKEEQERRLREEKDNRRHEKEEKEKNKYEEKVRRQLEKEHQKLLKYEMKKAKSEEKKEPNTEVSANAEPTKKQLKEQQRLERIAARRAIMEEKLKLKREKQMLREKAKHRELIDSNDIGKYVPAPAEIDSDIKKILQITDELLGELPEDVINRFMHSDDYDLYERILNKYKIR